MLLAEKESKLQLKRLSYEQFKHWLPSVPIGKVSPFVVLSQDRQVQDHVLKLRFKLGDWD